MAQGSAQVDVHLELGPSAKASKVSRGVKAQGEAVGGPEAAPSHHVLHFALPAAPTRLLEGSKGAPTAGLLMDEAYYTIRSKRQGP